MKQSCYRVMEYIDTHGSITALEAWTEIGVYDLRTRISEIRKAGFPIIGEYENGKNKYGEPVRFKRYRIGETS